MIYTVSVSTVLQQGDSKFKANKHGVWPVILTSINGAPLPENSSILDGSIAESLGITSGNSYALLITERASQTINGKVYKNYNYAVVGGNITAALGTQMAAVAITSISNMFAPSPAQVLIAQPPTPSPAPTPQPVLSQPVVDGDDSMANMSVAELEAIQKRLSAAKKAAKEKADADAAATLDAEIPF